MFKCDVVLSIPNIIMQPTLEEVQQTVNKAAQMILGVSKVCEDPYDCQAGTKSLSLLILLKFAELNSFTQHGSNIKVLTTIT